MLKLRLRREQFIADSNFLLYLYSWVCECSSFIRQKYKMSWNSFIVLDREITCIFAYKNITYNVFNQVFVALKSSLLQYIYVGYL